MPTESVQGAAVLASITDGDPGQLGALDPQDVIERVGIWLPLDVYARWPIMLPWAVRDLKSRSGGGRRPERWASADEHGYVVDDNSYIKGTARSLAVSGPSGSLVAGARKRTGFVAAHIWREVGLDVLASRVPALYSFVPNLVWLPAEIAKLSDIEGGVYQTTLQAMSSAIYRDAPVEAHISAIVGEAWDMLPTPSVTTRPVDLSLINWFVSSPSFYRTRTARLEEVIDALTDLAEGRPIVRKTVSSRYTAGLPNVTVAARARLLTSLARFDQRIQSEFQHTGSEPA